MKHLQQNLLILLALSLCALCVFQWREETGQRHDIQELDGMVFRKNTEIQGFTNSIAELNHQIEQMDEHLTEAKALAATNEQMVVSQKAEITRLQFANLNLTNTVGQYVVAMASLEAKLKDAYAGIEQQNEAITNLVRQRDEFVNKYNDEVKDRNDVVARYNELVKSMKPAAEESKPTQP